MATAPLSLFNTPQQYQQQQWAQAQEQAKALADMSASQRATYGAAMGGTMLGNALPGLLGVEDPELVKIKDIQGMFRGVDRNDYKSLESFAKSLADKGYSAEAEQAWQKAQELKKQSYEFDKTDADIALAKARAAAAGQQKQSTADIAARRQLISKVEKRLADGENIPDNDPELIQARAALAIETKPQSIKQEDGSIIQLPGIAGNEYAPLVSKRLGGVAAVASSSTPSSLSPEVVARLKGDEEALKRELSKVPANETERRTIIQSELNKVQQQLGMTVDSPVVSTSSSGPRVVQTPTSIRREEERTTALNTQAEGIDKSIVQNNNVLDAVGRAIEKTSKWSTGVPSTLSKGLGVSPAGELKTELDFIKANLTIETINNMKQQSKTGATGFGALSEKELNVVQSALVSLNQDNSEANVKKQLGLIKEHLALANQYLQKHKEELAKKGISSSAGSDAEALIQRNMAKNPGRSRAEIIDALRKAGKL